MPVKAKVISQRDQSLNTGTNSYYLFKDQVFTGDFKNQAVLDGLISIGVLALAESAAPEQKYIPVLFPPPVKKHLKQIEMVWLDANGEEKQPSGCLVGEELV